MTPTAETHAAYRKVYEAIKSERLRAELHARAHDPRMPAGIVRAWALAYMRWRVGDLDRYPIPPSNSIPGAATLEAALEQIGRADALVRELVPESRLALVPRPLAALRHADEQTDTPPPPRVVAPSTTRDKWRNEQ